MVYGTFRLESRIGATPVVRDIQNHEDANDVLQGTTEILGCSFHVRLVRVKGKPLPGEDDIVEPMHNASRWARECFDEIQKINEGALYTVHLPGIEGRFVMLIFPFAH